MSPRIQAIINPELLVWAREESGLDLPAAAKKAQVSADRLRSWETGERRPTVVQLRKLAQVYKRPIAVFYLSRPPKHFQALRDFRRLPGEVAGHESYALRLEIRRAHFYRDVALDLYDALGETPRAFAASARLSDDPEQVAAELRDLLAVPLARQREWRDAAGYDALNGWRAAVEDLDVLVLQAAGVEVAEARGFSISAEQLPVIAVNVKDAPRGRVFSMFHELSHLMLHQGGLCDMQEEQKRPPEEQRVEVFCNHVAGASLVPRDALLSEPAVAGRRRQEGQDEELRSLAQTFQVSREVILRRLLILDRTTPEFYRSKRQQYLKEYQDREPAGFATIDRQVIGRAGQLFIKLVLSSFYQEKITASRVAEYLGVRLKHMPKIEEAVMGRAIAFGATLRAA